VRCRWTRSRTFWARGPSDKKTIYVDIAENLQGDAVDRLGFLLEEPDNV